MSFSKLNNETFYFLGGTVAVIVLSLHQHPEVNFKSLKKITLILFLMVKFVTLRKFLKLDSYIIITIEMMENIDLVI